MIRHFSDFSECSDFFWWLLVICWAKMFEGNWRGAICLFMVQNSTGPMLPARWRHNSEAGTVSRWSGCPDLSLLVSDDLFNSFGWKLANSSADIYIIYVYITLTIFKKNWEYFWILSCHAPSGLEFSQLDVFDYLWFLLSGMPVDK